MVWSQGGREEHKFSLHGTCQRVSPRKITGDNPPHTHIIHTKCHHSEGPQCPSLNSQQCVSEGAEERISVIQRGKMPSTGHRKPGRKAQRHLMSRNSRASVHLVALWGRRRQMKMEGDLPEGQVSHLPLSTHQASRETSKEEKEQGWPGDGPVRLWVSSPRQQDQPKDGLPSPQIIN